MFVKKRLLYQPTLTFLLFSLISSLVWAQKPKRHDAAEIQLMLRKLNVLGSVMYIAAHPDDENTQMIAYMANEKLYQTAYMSCTRGDGGQNLIGTEMSELLGAIRTQELLAARRIDGGTQFFSRANDFGFSKHPDETFNIWNKEQVLADMVWNIRKFRPDILITRFSLEEGITHGHHTGSAILAKEAFTAAADPKRFPEQLKYVKVWQPRRAFWNTSWWFYQNTGRKFDPKGRVPVDVGSYSPLLGKSYTEIAAESRTMHKSQGFGDTGSRGSEVEYLELIAGDSAKNDPMEGVETTWKRVNGSDKVAFHTQNAYESFDPENPSLILPDLMQAYQALETLGDPYWKEVKRTEIKAIIKAVTGLYFEAVASDYSASPGDSVAVTVEVVNRSPVAIKLNGFAVKGLSVKEEMNAELEFNKSLTFKKSYKVPESMPYSQPYYLQKQGTIGMYSVDDQLLRGLPESQAAFMVSYTFSFNGLDLEFESPFVFKRNDRVDGEVYRPFVVTPPVFSALKEKVYVFGNDEARNVQVTVKAGRAGVSGEVSLQVPDGWKVEPTAIPVSLSLKGSEQVFEFSVTPPKKQGTGKLVAQVSIGGKKYNSGLLEIQYDHIPVITLFPEASAKAVKIDIEKKGQLVGYIMGAGDEIPASLRQIGYDVEELTADDLGTKNLQVYDAIILGVRALNTVEKLKYENEKLFAYAENGGTVVVQYLTSGGIVTDNIAPYPIKIGRGRVTVEEAPVTFPDPKHPLLNSPNKITEKDFEGWVQERGLYFASEWDEKFVPVLASNDPGEEPLLGGLLVAKHGKGYYVYTGYSWFRELPAGVPGAYRLFTNIISLGKE